MDPEVVIIGGGPGGTQCAHDLANRKVSVVGLKNAQIS